jgi:hypothetical protein
MVTKRIECLCDIYLESMVHWLINKGRLSGGSLMRLQQINHFPVTFGTKQCLEMGRTKSIPIFYIVPRMKFQKDRSNRT